MRWKSMGSSATGFAPYFSESLSIASWTMSRALSGSRTAKCACLYARRSTLARNSASSAGEASDASFFVGPERVDRGCPMVSKARFHQGKLDQSGLSNYPLMFHRISLGNSMELTGAEIVVRSLQAEGVEYVFGYPGGAVLFIYDELFKQDRVKHILVRHEQGATHA